MPAAYLFTWPIGLALAGAMLFCAVAKAGEAPPISEIRAGILLDRATVYPVPIPWLNTIDFANIDTVSLDVLFRSPEIDAFRWLGSPRPTLGVTLNWRNESMAHLGLTWHIAPPDIPVFLEFEGGGAVHNGALNDAASTQNLGCRALLYAAFNLGWQLTDTTSIMLTEQHASHFGICGANNAGLNYLGVRVGQAF